MKKAGLIALIGILLSGCSYTDFLPKLPSNAPPPPAATATVYQTPTSTLTVTPTQPTPTFTATPTLIYLNGTPTSPSPTATILPGDTTTDTASLPTSTPQALVANGPFSSILVSGTQLLWGSCEPSSVTATVKVSPGVPVARVLIFLRLQDVHTNESTAWGGGAIMNKQGDGLYSYTLTAKSFTHYREFPQAWGQYQFVVLDASLRRVDASTEYLSNLTIAPCP